MSANILLLETSGDICSVALLQDKKVIAERSVNEKNSHSKLLAGMVNELLSEASVNIGDLSGVAISAGPGSYTGLRIGASLAKGICFAQSIPLISVSSLAAIAYAMREGTEMDAQFATLIDARREDAYVALFDQNLKEIQTERFTTLDADYLASELKANQILFGGSGAEKAQNMIVNANAFFMDIEVHARHLAQMAFDKYEQQAFEDVSYFEPNYIKSVYVTVPKNPIKK